MAPVIYLLHTIELVTREAKAKFLSFVNADVCDFSEEVKKAIRATEASKNIIDSQNLSQLISDVRKMDGKLSSILTNMENLPNMANQVSQIYHGIKLISAVSWLNIALSVANIGVSIVGFAVVSKKINKISSKIDELSAKIDEIDKKLHDVIEKTDEIQKIQKHKLLVSTRKKIMHAAKVILADYEEEQSIDPNHLVE